jgi:predicted outer membrane repeat protein
VRKALTLIGRATANVSYPTLDGDGRGITLTVLGIGRVELRNLRITGGKGDDRHRGGGLHNKARLILSGDTRVEGNKGEFGAGVWTRGWLELRDEALVRGNRAVGFAGVGGGIYNAGGVTQLLGSSLVRDNVGYNGGGLFVFNGRLVMRSLAAVTGNVAKNSGGGIYSEGEIRMTGSASVTDNTAASSGGGIYNSEQRVHVCSSDVKLSPNDPDDPPQTKPCS